MVDFVIVEETLVAWLAAATGLPIGTTGATSGVYNDDAKVGAVAMPFATYKMGPLRRASGSGTRDEQVSDFVPTNPNMLQIVTTIVGRREFTVAIDIKTKDLTGAGTAKELMAKVEAMVQRPSQRDIFNAAGLAFLGFENPINLDQRDGPFGQGRVVQDFYFSVMSIDTDTGTFIETVTAPIGTITP